MTIWLIILGSIYITTLLSLALYSKRRTKSTNDFMMAGSNIGLVLGFMTFAATLFSTFTLMGMPDFFRHHGIAAWIFLAVSDGGMVFLIVWFGYHLRKKVSEKGYQGLAGLLHECYKNKLAGYVYFLGAFVFLIPYVAIQIRGVSIFLNAIFPELLPSWIWASFIIVIMLIYSEIGGLKGIMYADFMQGTILLITVWLIASNCVAYFGGIGEMFAQVEASNPALLSAPGPNGLFSVHFLVSSFLAILLIPVTQPQLTTRLVVMRNLTATHRMAVAVGFFAIMIILPTVAIGMYGAVRYPDATTSDYLTQVLLFDQPMLIASITVIGLIAAALSTSDSQIFALGGEFRSILGGDEKKLMLQTRVAVVFFGLAALVFSILSSDQLVLLARVSFAGTSLMAPMIIAAILSSRPPGLEVVILTATGLLFFIGSLFGYLPQVLFGLRIETFILISLALLTSLSFNYRRKTAGA
ncbi:MAG: sodium:solute symporter family protein [Deferribacteres bacterium]|nr:sodium:solute symporter family protein [Deferribacteres bacterium]